MTVTFGVMQAAAQGLSLPSFTHEVTVPEVQCVRGVLVAAQG